MLSRKWHERDNKRLRLTARHSLTAESGQIFRRRGLASSLLHMSGEGETARRNEVANGQENQTVGPH